MDDDWERDELAREDRRHRQYMNQWMRHPDCRDPDHPGCEHCQGDDDVSKPNDGGWAFPSGQISEVTGQPVNGFYDPGMSLRDYFAAKALQALIASNDVGAGDRIDEIPEYAYLIADAMLKAREK